MAGSQIATSVTIINSLLGFEAVSLTTVGSTPAIAAGSKVEIGSAFFTFESDDTPQASTWSSISTGETAYITLTPTGVAGSQTLVKRWSSTAPTWNDSRQGWYDSTVTSVIRYVAAAYKGGATTYGDKVILESEQSLTPRVVTATVLDIGAWNMNYSDGGSLGIWIAHGLANLLGIVSLTATIVQDGEGLIWDLQGQGGSLVATALGIYVSHLEGSSFDNSAFNGLTHNRGHVTVIYEH